MPRNRQQTEEEILARTWNRWANPRTNPIDRYQRRLDRLTDDLEEYKGPPIPPNPPRNLPAGWERYA